MDLSARRLISRMPSYREILGSKLAAMSLFVSDIQDTYLDRYASTPAEIASAMAGRPICKKAHVCILTTTSLYKVGSGQYNRVRMRFGDRILEWKKSENPRASGPSISPSSQLHVPTGSLSSAWAFAT